VPKTAAMSLRICVLQINPLVGAVQSNTEKIRDLMRKNADNVDLFVTPELAIIGYSPRDLLSQPALIQAEQQALEVLRQETAELEVGLLIGHTEAHAKTSRSLLNVATLYDKGYSLGRIRKRRIPYYDIFEEDRFFESWEENDQHPLVFRGTKIGINICEDAWWEIRRYGIADAAMTRYGDLLHTQHEGAELILNLSASPFAIGKPMRRLEIFSKHCEENRCPLVFASCAGAQDEILFDGHSFALNSDGSLASIAKNFEEDLLFLSFDRGKWGSCSGATDLPEDDWNYVLAGLQKGIEDYVHKTGFEKIHLGLSGGIDSALVAYLAAEALGPENVYAISMPTKFNSEATKNDARMLAEKLGIHFEEIPISDILNQSAKTMKLEGTGLAFENLQSRIRGMTLMTQSAVHGSLVLATGNKSEFAMGYATLYGDMCGAIAPIGDLYKTQVFELCHHIQNSKGRPFPPELLSRPPSAELAEGQTDNQSLPDYFILDVLLEDWIENQGLHEEVLRAFLKDISQYKGPLDFDKLRRTFMNNEFKRTQAAPILKLQARSFGSGWRMPLAKKLQTGRDLSFHCAR